MSGVEREGNRRGKGMKGGDGGVERRCVQGGRERVGRVCV